MAAVVARAVAVVIVEAVRVAVEGKAVAVGQAQRGILQVVGVGVLHLVASRCRW